MTTHSSVPRNAWCVFNSFDFLMHVEAADEAEARQIAASRTGLEKRLTVYLEDDTVNTFAGRNTFSLFALHGGLSIDMTETRHKIGPISRDDFTSMLNKMEVWVQTPEAALAAEDVDIELENVTAKIADFNALLNNPRWAYKTCIKIELGRDVSREFEKDLDRADAYSNFLYTSSPED
ncbi:hypothetical protein ACEN2T_17855 [Pseudomonas sp. W22_MBD1_FP4]|uniref:hypothetical protein n=1 Tax=Pseudomonas sp. W22_MBD1_FP4 TaxID=3240272 RepID=UPI003F9D77AF